MRGVIRLMLGIGLALAWALPASASTWAAPVTLSDAGETVTLIAGPLFMTPDRPSVAVTDTGYGITAWTQAGMNVDGIRVALHAPGGAWTTLPGTVTGALPGDACSPFATIDPSGNAMVVWSQWSGSGCGSGNRTMKVATRGVGGAASWTIADISPSETPINDAPAFAASNASGQMVVAWESEDSTQEYVFAAVGSPTTGFDAETHLISRSLTPTRPNLSGLTAAMGPNGDCAVQWSEASGSTSVLWVSPKTSAGNFSANSPESVDARGSAAVGSVAVDAAGDLISVYRYTPDGNTFSWISRYRTAGGVRQSQQTIAAVSAGFFGVSISAGFDDAGNATVVWMENTFTTTPDAPMRLFTATRAAGDVAQPWANQSALNDLADGSERTVRIAVAPSGEAVIASGLVSPTSTVEALLRPAGGTFGGFTPVGAGTTPALSLSPNGTAAMAFVGASGETRVSVLDPTAPVITAATVPASANVGQAVAMTAAVGDTWGLASGQPTWSFGDGATGAGGSVSHAFAKPGTYTVTVAASDASGNAAAPAARQIVVKAVTTGGGGGSGSGGGTSPPPAAGTAATSVDKAKLKASYLASKLVGSVNISGSAGVGASLTIAIRKHGAKSPVKTSTFTVKAGIWSHAVKLPATLAPGRYDAIVTGKGITGGQTSFAIAAPKAGRVTRAYATGPRKGPAATVLGSTSELWAHFVFGTKPKASQKITTQWILPGGKKLGANTRPNTSPVEAQVKDLSGKALPVGTWHCVLRAGGAVVATITVRLK